MRQSADIEKAHDQPDVQRQQTKNRVPGFSTADDKAFVVEQVPADTNSICARLLAQFDEAVIAVDVTDRIIYLNNAAERLYGLSASVALGMPQSDVFTAAPVNGDDKAGAATAQRASGEGNIYDIHLTHDGRKLCVECRIQELTDEVGNPDGRIYVIRDGSARHHDQAAVLHSDTRYRRLFEAAHDGMLIVDAETRKIVDANPFILSMLGYPYATLVGKEIFEIGLFRDAQASRDMFETLNVTGQIRYENMPFQAQDGARREVEVVANRYAENGRSIIQFQVRDITERIKAQTALADNDIRFRLALKNSSISVFEQDLDLRYNWIYNPRLGYDASSVIGKIDAELMDASVVAQLTALKQKVLATGQPTDQEVCVAAPEQAPFHFHLTVEPRRDTNGTIIGIVGCAVDITQRKEAEAAIHESEVRYRTMIDATSSVTWSCPPSGLLDQPQPKWMEYTGQSAAEILGAGWTNALHPEDAKVAREKWADAVARSEPYQNEVRVRRHDGVWRWMRIQSAPIYRNGLIAEWFWMCVDISARKQAEAALRDNDLRLTRILDHSPAGIVQTDADGRIVLVNNRWCEMLGYDRNEMLGMLGIDVTHPSSVEATVESVDRLAKGGPDFQIRKNYRRKDGVMLRCSSNIAALRDADGTYQGLIAVVLDMTTRYDAEDQLRESDRHNQFLLALSDRLRNAADAKTVMATAAELFARHCGLPLAQYLLIDPDGDQFTAVGRYSDGWLPDQLKDKGRLSDHGPGWAPQFHNDESVFSDDYGNRPEADASASQVFGIRSGSAVPLLRNGQLVAIFTTASPEPRFWTDAEKLLQQEVAQRTWAAVERARAKVALQDAHDTFRSLIDRSPFGTYLINADFCLVQISDGGRKAFIGVHPLVGRDFAEVVHAIWPEGLAGEIISRFRHTLASGEPYKADFVERRTDVDTTEAYDWKIERVILPDGRPGVVCHFYDFTEKQHQKELINLLMGEINHRSKNMLSIIQAIAHQTARTQPQQFLEVFGQRLRALSASQDLLVKGEWKAVDLDELVRSQLAHFEGELDGRITIGGPVLKITASASQSLGMALHELATNAAKFGSLSNVSGKVTISWRLQSDAGGQAQFEMCWIESDGPPITKPARLGFGSAMIDSMLRTSLGCAAEIDFSPSGLSWKIECPASGIIQGDVAPPPWDGNLLDHQPAPLSGHRILVVEDEPVIAMVLSMTLSDAGYVVIGPANSVSSALALLAQHGCDAALLDVNLNNETSEPVARELMRRGNPFISLSGYSREQLPTDMQAAPLLKKPVSSEMIIAEIERFFVTR